MQLEWPPVEIDPDSFSPESFQNNFLDFASVLQNLGPIAQAVLVTVSLALIAEVVGLAIGLVLALLKISRSRILSGLTQVYIDVFRGTPLLVQITIIYFATPPIGLRFNSLFFAGLTALALNNAAYAAEVFRSGIQSIDRGQMEAGRASGLTYAQTMRHIIIPQAVRRTIPPLTNEFVILIKDTSLVSVIGLVELLRVAQEIQSETATSTSLLVAAFLYLAICLPLIYLANGLERRLNRRTA